MRTFIAILILVLLASILLSCESKSRKLHKERKNKEVYQEVKPNDFKLIKVRGHLFLIENKSQPLHIPNCSCMSTPQ